ncbi:MAG: DUF3515 domain-containing protein [Mycobacteriales bacterium]
MTRSVRRRAALVATAAALPVAIVVGVVTARLTAARPVSVPEPPGSVTTRQLCPKLIDSLPHRLGSLEGRKVEGAPRLTAAWGDPAVTLQCGMFATPSPLGAVVTLDGVDWSPVTDSRGVTWTTVGRKAAVRVLVPKKYDDQAPLLAQLSPRIVAVLPVGR